jgi:hypothetical protein
MGIDIRGTYEFAVMVCNTSNVAFGPLMDSEEEGEFFLAYYMRKHGDPRTHTVDEVVASYNFWRDARPEDWDMWEPTGMPPSSSRVEYPEHREVYVPEHDAQYMGNVSEKHGETWYDWDIWYVTNNDVTDVDSYKGWFVLRADDEGTFDVSLPATEEDRCEPELAYATHEKAYAEALRLLPYFVVIFKRGGKK